RRLFDQMGYRIDIAGDGLEAVQAWERQHYDIVFMDVQMPEMDGLEATRRIREREKERASGPHMRPPTTIIAMTADAMIGDREKCLQSGMDDYLSKPVRPGAVQAALRRWGPVARGVANRPVQSDGKAEPDGQLLAAGETSSPVQEDLPVDLDRLIDLAGGDEAGLGELTELYLA